MSPTIQSGFESDVSSHRFFFLFLFLLAALILYPYAEGSRIGYYTLRFLGTAVIFLSVYAVSFRRRLLVFALVLAVPAFYLRIVVPKINPTSFSIVNMVLSFAFDVFIVVTIFRRVFSKEQANSETIFGALCIYLLVGFSFASVYGMVAAFQPKAFYLDPLGQPPRCARPVRSRVLQFWHDDFAGRGGNYPGLRPGTFAHRPRSPARRAVSRRLDRKTDGSLPFHGQALAACLPVETSERSAGF